MCTETKIGTTTQTGPDNLSNYRKEIAVEKLKDLWCLNPRWIPQEINQFKYPFISQSDYGKICGFGSSLPEKYLPLLELQKRNGFLTTKDVDIDDSFFKNNIVSVAGAGFQEREFIYLLDPINGKFFQLPNTPKGIRLYNEFYSARFHYIESIPNAFKFLGREKTYISKNESAKEALDRTVVFVCGLGTGGGETAIRLGKQFPGMNLILIDGGIFGPENIDRQAVTSFSVGLNKSLAVAAKIFEINPMIKNLHCIPNYISKENAGEIFMNTLKQMGDISNPIIQIVDEIDVTEEETLIAKAELHHEAIKLAAQMNTPVYVHWSLDVGASGEVVGTCRYTGNETKIFNGKYSIELAQLPAILAMFKMVPKKAVGLEMIEDIKSRLARDGKMEHISQTGLSAIGVAKVICTRLMLTSLGYGKKIVGRSFSDDLRKSFQAHNRFLAAIKRFPATLALSVYGNYNRYRSLRKTKG